MAGIELQNYAIVHEMSNQQSEKPELPQNKPGSSWENQSLPTTLQLHLFCTTWSLFRTILDPASWWLSQSCDSYAVSFCCRHVGTNVPNKKHMVEHLWHGSTTSTVACGKTRMARKPTKTTAAWWLALNSKTMPLFMKCQINNRLKPNLPQNKPGSS